MTEIKFRLQYLGDFADDHRLPAHEGAKSLEGISWAFSLLGHYMATGKIRKQGNLDPRIQFYITPAQRGSFITDIVAYVFEPQNVFITSIAGAYTVNTLTNNINSFVKYCFKRTAGLFDDEKSDEYKKLNKLPSGDLEANLDAIEPSLKRAHEVIGDGAKSLLISKARTPLLTLDGGTKNYINTNIYGDNDIDKIVSIGALNVNTGNGTAYIPDIGKTAPFSVVKEPAPGTYEILSTSLSNYAKGRPSHIKIICTEIFGLDSRIKKLIISSATPI